MIHKATTSIHFIFAIIQRLKKFWQNMYMMTSWYVPAYYMEQNNPTSTDCSAGLYLKGASLTILALCWENCIGFPWSIGSVTKFCCSPTRHWMAMLHNISQHWYKKNVPPRPLRSEDQYLNSPRWRFETFGKRAFSKAAPTLWNPLPLSVNQAPSIDTFKTRLKTYLFNKAFL